MIRTVAPGQRSRRGSDARTPRLPGFRRRTGNQGSGTSSSRDYGRDHQVTADGRPPIAASSEPLPRGDPARWNPELELTAALSQCHMLWYLHPCAVSGAVVTSYADDAHGTMEETDDGSGQFTAARSYRHFIGPEPGAEPHRHDGNQALHYDLARADPASGYHMMLHLAQAEPGRHTTGAQIGITIENVDAVHQKAPQFRVTVLQPPDNGQRGRCATYQNPDRNTISVTTTARPAPAAGQATGPA